MSIRHILSIIFIIQIHICTFANSEADSLIYIVKEYEKQTHFESDTNYINALIDAAEILASVNLDSSYLYSEKAYNLSTKYNYHGNIRSAFLMCNFYFEKEDSEKMFQIANEILPIVEKTDRKTLGSLYSFFAASYYYKDWSDVNNLLEAVNYGQKTLEIYKEYNDTTKIISSLSSLSVFYSAMYDYSTA